MNHILSNSILRTSIMLAILCLFQAFIAGCAGKANTTKRIDENKTYSFWPLFPDEPRVQFLTSYQYSSDIEPEKSGLESLVFGEDSSTLAINKPYGVEMWQGKIYVCDNRGDAVIILDLVNSQTKIMKTSGMGGMSQPTDIAIAPDGMKYVGDFEKNNVYVFDANDRHVTTLGHPGFAPVGLAVHGDELYACDRNTKNVKVLNRFTGELLRSIGTEGGEEGQFLFPLGIDVDNDGYVYVTDAIRCRYQKFSPEGEFISASGQVSDTVGSFNRPKHMDVDSDGIIYIVDGNFNNVQMFNNKSEILMFFGAAGSHEGAMNLPAGLCVNEEDVDLFKEYLHPDFEAKRLILVTNQYGRNKVSVYAMGQLRAGVTVNDIMPSITPSSSGMLTKEEEAKKEAEAEAIRKQREQNAQDGGS